MPIQASLIAPTGLVPRGCCHHARPACRHGPPIRSQPAGGQRLFSGLARPLARTCVEGMPRL